MVSYGSPRVWEALQKQGVICGENRVARLMRHAGLTGRVVRVTRRQPGLHRFFIATPNLRQDQPLPSALDRQWVGDITYLKARGRFCYLAGGAPLNFTLGASQRSTNNQRTQRSRDGKYLLFG